MTTFEIYFKSYNYREIYDAFMNIGNILKSQTLKEIANISFSRKFTVIRKEIRRDIERGRFNREKNRKKWERKYSVIWKLVRAIKSSTQPLLLKKNLISQNEPNKNNQLNLSHNQPKYLKLLKKPINSLKKGLFCR